MGEGERAWWAVQSDELLTALPLVLVVALTSLVRKRMPRPLRVERDPDIPPSSHMYAWRWACRRCGSVCCGHPSHRHALRCALDHLGRCDG